MPEVLLSVREAASLLGISAATLRNWAKAGAISPVQSSPFRFSRQSVNTLSRSMAEGKLTKRANKSRSRARIACTGTLRKLSKLFLSIQPGLENAMYVASLHRLKMAGELELDRLTPIHFRRRCVEDAVTSWRKRLREPERDELYAFFLALPDTYPDEFPGELYLALCRVGSRARRGSYYTSCDLVDESLRFGAGAGTFLDPCCGTGHYLVRAAKLLGLPEDRIYGIDLDPVAVELARINLLLAFPGKEFTPNIFRGNALSNRTLRNACRAFDLIATNPPWGAAGTGDESFVLFLERALELLPPGGKLSFLLPEAVLNIRAHAAIRQRLVGECRIERIELLGRRFPGVYTAALRLDAVKGAPPPEHCIEIVHGASVEQLPQSRIAGQRDSTFEIHVNAVDRRLLEKIFHTPHCTLAGRAQWALGIVTGDNRRFLADAPEPGAEPILRGCDLAPNRISPPKKWLRTGVGRIQQMAPEAFYRTPGKLVYRFISGRLIFAVDEAGYLTLNSANILIPHLPGWSPSLTAKFLNSALAAFAFSKRFATCKVLKSDLELLPFPLLTAAEFDEFANLGPEALEERFFDCFNLSGEERKHLRRSVNQQQP